MNRTTVFRVTSEGRRPAFCILQSQTSESSFKNTIGHQFPFAYDVCQRPGAQGPCVEAGRPAIEGPVEARDKRRKPRRGDVIGLESILLETNSLVETSQPRRGTRVVLEVVQLCIIRVYSNCP